MYLWGEKISHVQVLVYCLFLTPLRIGFTRLVFSESQPLYPHLQDPTPNTAPSQALIRPFIIFKESR